MTTTDVVRDAFATYGNLLVPMSELDDDTDLYQAGGLTSHAIVNVMLAIEDELGIEFPDSLLSKDTFRSVNSITTALSSVGLVEVS